MQQLFFCSWAELDTQTCAVTGKGQQYWRRLWSPWTLVSHITLYCFRDQITFGSSSWLDIYHLIYYCISLCLENTRSASSFAMLESCRHKNNKHHCSVSLATVIIFVKPTNVLLQIVNRGCSIAFCVCLFVASWKEDFYLFRWSEHILSQHPHPHLWQQSSCQQGMYAEPMATKIAPDSNVEGQIWSAVLRN